ncbi:cytochrome p450 [Rhyzopertha dominica]|nr:cytochrome p450 [Rhyzopertha dominica]
MDPITLLLLLVLLMIPSAVLLKAYFKKRQLAYYVNKLPGPPVYPIFGTAYEMLRTPRNQLFSVMRKRVQTFAPLFRSWYGSYPAVHLMKPEHIELVMGSTTNITKGPLYKFIMPWLGTGLLTGTGLKWHSHRKLITPTFHFKILEHFQEVFDEKGHMLAEQLSPKANGEVFDVYPFITHCALDVICENDCFIRSQHDDISAIYSNIFLLPVKVSPKIRKEMPERALNNEEHPQSANSVRFCIVPVTAISVFKEGPEKTAMGVQINAMRGSSSEYIKAVYGYVENFSYFQTISELALQRNYNAHLHNDFMFRHSKLGKEFQKYLDVLHGFTNKVIGERKEALRIHKGNERRLSSDDLLMGRKNRLAFLDLLIEASKGGSVLTDTDIREEVDTFMFEGHDTTTAGICWSLFLLGNYPDVQERVAQELDDIFNGDDRSITVRDLGEMKYLERVIKEALRLYPSVPFISRTLSEDIVLDGHKIPASCGVIIHIYDVHRDERYYPNPERFDPDRFLPENAKSRHPYAYVPFSAGPRNCIGQKFAMNEEKTLIASIIRKYRVRAVEKQESVKLMSELILRPQEGIRITLEPRYPLLGQ